MEENKSILVENKDKTKEKDQNYKKTCDFLDELYKNAQMGKLAFEYLLPKTKDSALKEELLNQFRDFESLCTKISEAIIELKRTPKSSLGFAKPMLRHSINVKMIFNSSASKIADMLTQGNNQGIMDINRLINSTTGKVTDKAISMAKELLALEQKHIDRLKKWL